MVIHLETIFLPHEFIDIRGVLNIHIEYLAAILAPEVMVLDITGVVPFQPVRQRNLTYDPIIGKHMKTPVNRRFAYGGMLFMNLSV